MLEDRSKRVTAYNFRQKMYFFVRSDKFWSIFFFLQSNHDNYNEFSNKNFKQFYPQTPLYKYRIDNSKVLSVTIILFYERTI